MLAPLRALKPNGFEGRPRWRPPAPEGFGSGLNNGEGGRDESGDEMAETDVLSPKVECAGDGEEDGDEDAGLSSI